MSFFPVGLFWSLPLSHQPPREEAGGRVSWGWVDFCLSPPNTASSCLLTQCVWWYGPPMTQGEISVDEISAHGFQLVNDDLLCQGLHSHVFKATAF